MSRVGGYAEQTRAAVRSTVFARSAVSTWIVAGVAAIVAALAIATGGMSPAERVPTPLMQGEEARTDLYAVTALDAELTDEVESEYLSADPGEKLLVVTFRMRNLADYPIGVGGSVDRVQSRLIASDAPLLSVSGIPATFDSRAWRVDGSGGRVVLQPGVPAEVRVAWRVPDDAFADDAVRIDVHEADPRNGQVIIAASNITWHRGAQAAQITLAVDR